MWRVISGASRAFDKVNDALAAAAATLLVLTGVSIALNAFGRIFNLYIPGYLEFARYGLVWITFLGTTWLLIRNGHVPVDIVTATLKAKSASILDLACNIFCFCLFAIMTWASISSTITHFQTGYYLSDSVYFLPKAPIESIVAPGCALLALELLRKIYRFWGNSKTQGGN